MASLVRLGHQAVTDVMAVTEPKVIREAQGRLDSRGLLVSWGPAGLNGQDGAKGQPGVQGPPGQKGERGESEEGRRPRNPSLMPFKNWKECAWKNLDDDTDNGLIKVSGLRVLALIPYRTKRARMCCQCFSTTNHSPRQGER